MQPGMPRGVENREEDEACGADDGEGDGQARENFFYRRGVGDEAALVAKPAVGEERNVEKDGGKHAAGDEEGLQVVGADVRDVGYMLVVGHGGVVPLVSGDNPVEEEAQEGG